MTRAASVLGAGPAGLMAAEILSANGIAVTVFDRMPSAGRKFLMAGRGGLNLTHSEDFAAFVARYGEAKDALRPMLEAFPPAALIQWAEGLGQPTFVGSSGRVFPKTMKASPLLRAWLARLTKQGVQFRMRHTWLGWGEDGALLFRNAEGGTARVHPDVTVLALGGASWPKLGSNGAWVRALEKHGVTVTTLLPANSGFTIGWSEIFRERFAGQPLKNANFRSWNRTVRGEAMITRYGIEGGAIYALGADLRGQLTAEGIAELTIDLRPDHSAEQIAAKLGRPRGKDSLSNYLRKAVGLAPVEINLLREVHGAAFVPDPAVLAKHIKAVPLTLGSPPGIERAISTAGGVSFNAVDEHLMLRAVPGAFAAGEMLDWEAPTGGYLLQASFATGVTAAKGAIAWLRQG
jgi:uncharacterized flavoprotein (TIGR03862 family)